MNNLVRLIKLASVFYHAWRLKDKNLMDEVNILLNDVPKSKESIMVQDKETEQKIRNLVKWIEDQPEDSSVITSLLSTKLADIALTTPELESCMKEMFKEIKDSSNTRQFIFATMADINKERDNDKFKLKFSSMVKPFIYDSEREISKEDWLKLNDLITEKLTSLETDATDKAVVEEASNDNPETLRSVIEQLKVDSSPEGIIRTGLSGLNEALGPDFGFKRGLAYMVEALTNRGKSLSLGHIIASIPMYNRPCLRDKTRIPTVVLMSAEDSLGLIIKRMYELFVINKTGAKPDFFEKTTDEVIDTILKTFEENGWSFKFYRVNPSNDTIYTIQDRIRGLIRKGHEIIFTAYDYLGMANLSGCLGESRSDKLQDLYRRGRNFFSSIGSVFITPAQLNPDAKKFIRELDDESEVYFIKNVGGKSMTEGSTKLTNEMDVVIGIHVAKLENGSAFWTYYVGKVRGDGAPEADRFGIYPLDPILGLVHDINFEKKTFRKTIGALGGNAAEGDDFESM